MGSQVHWDQCFDVVVVGSGAGGMTAALLANDLGLKALVIEQSDLIGGATAVSAGVIWVPDNPLMENVGYKDSKAEAMAYLRKTIGDGFDEEKLSAYIETGIDLVQYLDQHSDIKFQAAPLPDYYSNFPGGKDKYRALDPLPLSAKALGEDIDSLRPSHPQIVVFGMTFTTAEVATVLRKDAGWLSLIVRQMLQQYRNLLWRRKHKRSPRLTLGNALVARCMLSLRKRGIPIWTNTALKELVFDANGVHGVVAEQNGRQVCIKAEKGVILATGGFGSNAEMRKTYLKRAPDIQRSVAPAVNNGDGIRAGVKLGAATDLMDEAWWIPVYRLNESQLTCGMFLERGFPGCMIVNSAGRRFMNDAANYDEAGRAMANANETAQTDLPAYYIFDATYRRRYIAGPLQASPPIFDHFLKAEVRELLVKAGSLEELAEKLKIAPDALADTVRKFNEFARSGKDEDFQRGEEAYDRHYSDPKVGPNSTMAPLLKPPFYAIPVFAGDIGTKGGLITDVDARVIKHDGSYVPGLYAIGNTAASLMRCSYPGGGVTIGPSMVFGARAALSIAGKELGAAK